MSERDDFLNKANSQNRYTVKETSNGFTVHGVDREPVKVTRYPTFLTLGFDGTSQGRLPFVVASQHGFYEYYKLSRHIAEILMVNWQPPERDDGRKPWVGLHDWVITVVAKAIGKRVHYVWKRLLGDIDPDVLAVHRAVFAATMGTCELAMDEELYRHKYIVSDIVHYRAAAIAAANVTSLAAYREKQRTNNSEEAIAIRAQLTEIKTRAAENGITIRTTWNVDDSVPDPLTAMQDWRGLFSYNGEPYRSLNRTLMNLPGGIPHTFLRALTGWRLERPYTKRLELLTLLVYGDLVRNRINANIFEHAGSEQIKEAVRRVAAHTRNELTARRTRDVKFTVKYLGDFPDPHGGNIVGLADKSIVWHRDEREREIASQVDRWGDDTKTAAPPELPETPGITFLDTVGAVCREGTEMGHCIASYVDQAVSGNCYLFHVDHKGDLATVEVASGGQSVQAHGPHNQKNGAARWGQRVLSRWGKKVAQIGPPQILGSLPKAQEVQAGNEEIPF